MKLQHFTDITATRSFQSLHQLLRYRNDHQSTQDRRVDSCHPLPDCILAKLSISMQHLGIKLPQSHIECHEIVFLMRDVTQKFQVASTYLGEGSGMCPPCELTNTIFWLNIILSCDIIVWCYHSLIPFIFSNKIIIPKIIISRHLVLGGMNPPGGMCPPTLVISDPHPCQ